MPTPLPKRKRIFLTALVLGLVPIYALSDRPNVLLIMTDNQSASLLGAYGNPDIETPNIDRLAAEGALFERAYATTGVCSPSRAVLLTGLIPSANGVHNGLPARYDLERYSAIAEFRNWPQVLADSGYRTGLVGKYHLGSHEEPTLGFDFWVTFRGGHTTSFIDAAIFDNGERYDVAQTTEHLTDFWTRRAIDFIRDQERGQPFFLWLSYNGPYILPPTVNEPPVSRFAEGYADDPPAMPQKPVHPYLRSWAQSVSRSDDPDIAGGSYPWAAIDALNNRRAIINVAAETTHVDAGIGEVLETLQQTGLDDDTVVVFLSDQGSAYGQLGLWGNSSWGEPPPAYNANMQIPLIIRHPGKIAPNRLPQMIDQFDIFPTLLDYLGIDSEIENSPGKSFAPLLRGETVEWENEVFFEYITTRVIQTPRWKYTKRFLDAPDELYDLLADPGETNNLAADPAHRDVLAELGERLTGFFERYANPEFDPWRGGTGKALLFYDDRRTQRFRDAFPSFREPFVEHRPAFTEPREPERGR